MSNNDFSTILVFATNRIEKSSDLFILPPNLRLISSDLFTSKFILKKVNPAISTSKDTNPETISSARVNPDIFFSLCKRKLMNL